MEGQLQRATFIDGRALSKRHSRRAWFKTCLESALVGAGAGALTKAGVDYVAREINDVFENLEQQLRTMTWNLSVLSGKLETKIKTETEELKKRYSDNTLALYEAAGFATSKEIGEVEKLIQNSEKIQSYYTFIERAREFKDRIDKANLELGERLHSLQPKPMQGVNRNITDAYAQLLRRMGYKIPETEEQIKAQRKGYKAKLDNLVKIYDTNENSRVAQGILLERINSYLSEQSIRPDERGMFEFLRDQLKQANGYDNVRTFLKNYETTDGSETNFMLRGLLSDMEANFKIIREDKTHLERLQRVTLDSIAMQEKIRGEYEVDYLTVRKEFEEKISELRGIVDDTIGQLKQKGYDVETREEYMARTPVTTGLSSFLAPIFDPLRKALVYGVGIGACALTLYARRNAIARKAQRNAFGDVVRRHNELAVQHNGVLYSYEGLNGDIEVLAEVNRGLVVRNITLGQEKHRLSDELANYKNTEMPQYIDGGGI